MSSRAATGQVFERHVKGARVLGPEKNPGNDLVIGHFADPEANVIGVAGVA